MRFVLSSWGTRGDFQPLLALALGLRAKGHSVALASSPSFASEAETFGVEYHPVGMDFQRLFTDPAHGIRATKVPVKMIREIIRELRDDIGDQVSKLTELAAGADVVVGAGATMGGHTAAEARGITYRYAAFSPMNLPSRYHAPTVFPLTGLPTALNRLAWNGLELITQVAGRRPFNEARRQLGLPPVGRYVPHLFPSSKAILAFDAELARAPADAPVPWPPTGFWQLPDDRPLTSDVTAFLDAGAPPVYIGFGSMPDPSPQATTQAIIQAVRSAKVRALVSSGWAALGGVDGGRDVLFVGSMPHAKLFPRLAAVVHHGGAGTTATAARAGVPQVLVPHAFDQYDWGARVAASGIGPAPIPRSKLSADRLRAALDRTLGDADVKRRATGVAERLQDRDGVAAAVSILTS